MIDKLVQKLKQSEIYLIKVFGEVDEATFHGSHIVRKIRSSTEIFVRKIRSSTELVVRKIRSSTELFVRKIKFVRNCLSKNYKRTRVILKWSNNVWETHEVNWLTDLKCKQILLVAQILKSRPNVYHYKKWPE